MPASPRFEQPMYGGPRDPAMIRSHVARDFPRGTGIIGPGDEPEVRRTGIGMRGEGGRQYLDPASDPEG